MPFKIWGDNVVLTSDDLNDYIQEQVVMTFASSSARSAAVTVPTEGMVSYLADTDSLEIYDGSAWQPYAHLGEWKSYTPTLTAVTTNPTLGSGSAQVGRYQKIGRTVHIEGSIRFGTSGVNAGSGAYAIGIPFAIGNAVGSSYMPVGMVSLRDDSASNNCMAVLAAGSPGDTTLFVRPWVVTAASFNAYNHSTPWAWAANDRLDFSATYEAQT